MGIIYQNEIHFWAFKIEAKLFDRDHWYPFVLWSLL